MQLHLLGPPQVEVAGRVLTIARRQVRALLYVLAVELEPIARTHLCFLFWPDSPDAAARRNLSHLLTHLRKVLPDPGLLRLSEEAVALDPARAWSDSAAILHAVRHLPGALPSDDPRWPELLAIVEAYRGPLLDGFVLPGCAEYELWVGRLQRASERAYLRLLDLLVERYIADRDLDAAIGWSQRHLAVDPLAEEVHGRLIRLYTAAGDRSAALRQFERCAIALERELGVHPLPVTRAAYEVALHDRATTAVHPSEPGVRPRLPARDPPLVGRGAALDRLRQVYTACEAGTGAFVLISGEAGIGKSRLMMSFAAEHAGSARLLAATGQLGAERLPYRPVIEILRALLGLDAHPNPRRGPAEPVSLPGLPEVWLAELSRLIPELRTSRRGATLPARADPAEARTRLIEAVCRAIAAAVDPRRPALICIDDLQWVDEATLDWLLCLAEGLDHWPCLVLAAYRAEDGAALAPFRDALTRRVHAVALPLDGLCEDEVLQLVKHAASELPGTPSADLLQALAARLTGVTAGNPFFILEILRAMADAGELRRDIRAPAALPLPDTIRQAVSARLHGLSPPAVQVLESGAILGTPFTHELVTLTSGRDEMETMDGLDELTSRQLLVERDVTYAFHHEMVRQVVQARISPVRAQLLHRRAGRALSQLGAGNPATVAEHFDLGGEPAAALTFYAQAVQQAETVFASQAVVQYQERMLLALDRLDPDRTHPDLLARRGEVLAARAHTHFLSGELAERDVDLTVLEELAGATGDRRLKLQALVHQARYLNLDARYAQALSVAQTGLDLATELADEAAQSRQLAQIGFAHYFLGQPEPALAALQSALAIAECDREPALRGRIMHILGYVHFHMGDYASALACQREAYVCHRAIGDLNRVAWDGLDIGAAHLELGDADEAEAQITEHLTLARQIGSRPAEAYGLTLLGCLALHLGHYASALPNFEAAAALQRTLHAGHGEVAAGLGIGLALSRLGDLAPARQRLANAAQQARAIAHRRRLAEVLLAQGLAETEAGPADAAQSYLAEALALARESSCWETVTAALVALAAVARRQGNVLSALGCAREAIGYAEAHALPGPRAWGESELGLALLAQGDALAALTHTGRAVAQVSSLHEAWIGTESLHHAHARVLRALGQDEAATVQRALAEACLARKASAIADPDLRRRYLNHARASLAR